MALRRRAGVLHAAPESYHRQGVRRRPGQLRNGSGWRATQLRAE